MIIDELKDFNEVIEYYKLMLKVLEKIKPGKESSIENEYVQKILSSKYMRPSYMAVCINESLALFKFLENNNGLQYGEKIDDIEKICANIKTKCTMCSSEKIKQVRNCLAHAEYKIIIDDEYDFHNKGNNKIKLYINNDKIEGDILYNDFYYYINNIYSEVLDKVYLVFYKVLLNVNKSGNINRAKLKRYLDTIQFDDVNLDENTKKFCIEYIEYIGFNNFNNAPEMTKNNILKNILINVPNNQITKAIGGTSNATMFMQTIQHYNEKDSHEKINILSKKYIWKNMFIMNSYQTPLIYTESVLGLGNYLLVYIRELNKNGSFPIFKYADMELETIPKELKEKFVKSKKFNAIRNR